MVLKLFKQMSLVFLIAVVTTRNRRQGKWGNGFTHKRNRRGGSVRAGEKALSEMIIPLARWEEEKKMTGPWRLLRERKGPAAI